MPTAGLKDSVRPQNRVNHLFQFRISKFCFPLQKLNFVNPVALSPSSYIAFELIINKEVKTLERGQEERKRHENPKKRIEGIFFDTDDPTTRLIGEKATIAGWPHAREKEEREQTFYEQLWRTKDAHYFVYSGLSDPIPLDLQTAHNYLHNDYEYRKFLTDKEMQDIELDDEKRHEGRF
jgi:hypothetical protein